MREIKFRAWDGKKNEWIHSGKDGMGCNILGETILFGNWMAGISILDLNDVVVEQFTGLRDKNGREIYEGDVVRIARYGGELQTHGEIFEEKGAFCVRNGYAVAETDILGQFKPDIIEVIGNIHENQELLK